MPYTPHRAYSGGDFPFSGAACTNRKTGAQPHGGTRNGRRGGLFGAGLGGKSGHHKAACRVMNAGSGWRKRPLTESVTENKPPPARKGGWARVKWRGKSPPPRAAKPGARKTLRGARQTGKTGRLPDPGGASWRDNPGLVAPGREAGNAGCEACIRGMTVDLLGDQRGTKSGL